MELLLLILATAPTEAIQLDPPQLPPWVPLKYPLTIFHDWWYLLLVPMSFGISLTYKAMRMPEEERIWTQAFLMTAQVLGGIIGLALVLTLFVQVVIPALS